MYLYVHCGSSAPAATRSERRSGATNDFPSWRGERPAVLAILMYTCEHCGSCAEPAPDLDPGLVTARQALHSDLIDFQP